MKCPFLLADPKEKVCRQMLKQGLDGELEDFDIAHYCIGNPNHCFFYRFHSRHINPPRQPEGDESKLSTAPVVPIASIMLNEHIQPEEDSSEKSDPLLKLKRFFHLI